MRRWSSYLTSHGISLQRGMTRDVYSVLSGKDDCHPRESVRLWARREKWDFYVSNNVRNVGSSPGPTSSWPNLLVASLVVIIDGGFVGWMILLRRGHYLSSQHGFCELSRLIHVLRAFTFMVPPSPLFLKFRTQPRIDTHYCCTLKFLDETHPPLQFIV